MKSSKPILRAFAAAVLALPLAASAIPPYSPPGTLLGSYEARKPDGKYEVVKGCLVAGTPNGAGIAFKPCDGNDAFQVWQDTASNGGLEIRNVGAGTCLTAIGSSSYIAFTATCEANQGLAQRWVLTNYGANGWRIQNAGNGRCLSSYAFPSLVTLLTRPCDLSEIYQRWY